MKKSVFAEIEELENAALDEMLVDVEETEEETAAALARVGEIEDKLTELVRQLPSAAPIVTRVTENVGITAAARAEACRLSNDGHAYVDCALTVPEEVLNRSLSRAEAIAIVGEEMVALVEGISCEPASEIVEKHMEHLSKWVADVSTDDYTLEVVYLLDAEEVDAVESLDNLDWDGAIHHYKITRR
jgi:DNA-binding transcriptional regulator YbjK